MSAQASDRIERGRITDESIELMRRRIGWSNPTIRTGVDLGPWWTEASFDAIRHWVNGYGDDNPLYCDEQYGERTRWKGLIAPPGFEVTMSRDVTPKPPEDFDRETRKALRGVQLYNSGHEGTWYRPIRRGDRLTHTLVVDAVEEKRSEFAGRSAIVTNRGTYRNTAGEIVAVRRPWYIHAERRRVEGNAGGGRTAKDTPASYSDEDLAKIDAAYEAEFRRGAQTLYFEDIEAGAALPAMVKGPASITDMINLHMGGGWFGYGNPALRLAYENRKRMRGFYTKNRFNAWDTIQRVHWDTELAREVGLPMMYDIGPMRWTWLLHYCTNFAGDDGWVYHVRGEFRRFNYWGDTTWITGTVVRKHASEELGPAIDIAVSGRNQRGDENLSGVATILLASRTHGAVKLPQPPASRG
jgi:acyl dehydratase